MGSLTFLGLSAGFLAWQFGLRRLVPLLSVGVVAVLFVASEADVRLPSFAKSLLGGLAILGMVPAIVGVLLVIALKPMAQRIFNSEASSTPSVKYETHEL